MSRQRLLGWWGHRLDTRFEMNNKMELSEGVAGYRMSTPSAILMAGVKGFLEANIFLLKSSTNPWK